MSYCDYHMMPHPCEMCKPTKCLTHNQPLPCKACNGQDVKVDQAVKDATIEQRLDNIDAAIAQINQLLSGKASQSQVDSVQTQISALSSEVTLLRSL